MVMILRTQNRPEGFYGSRFVDVHAVLLVCGMHFTIDGRDMYPTRKSLPQGVSWFFADQEFFPAVPFGSSVPVGALGMTHVRFGSVFQLFFFQKEHPLTNLITLKYTCNIMQWTTREGQLDAFPGHGGAMKAPNGYITNEGFSPQAGEQYFVSCYQLEYTLTRGHTRFLHGLIVYHTLGCAPQGLAKLNVSTLYRCGIACIKNLGAA